VSVNGKPCFTAKFAKIAKKKRLNLRALSVLSG